MDLNELRLAANEYKVRLLCAHLGQQFETLGVTAPASLEQLTLDGLDGGHRLPETNVTLLSLAEGSAFLPSEADLRGQILQWLFFDQNKHEPSIISARYWRSHSGRAEEMAPMIQFMQKRGRDTLASMDEHLEEREFFAADRYTIADISLFADTHLAEEGGFELGDYPSVQAWLWRVREQPGFVDMPRA